VEEINLKSPLVYRNKLNTLLLFGLDWLTFMQEAKAHKIQSRESLNHFWQIWLNEY